MRKVFPKPPSVIFVAVLVVLSSGCEPTPWWQNPDVTWITAYGGEESDVGEGMLELPDGDWLFVGTTGLRFGPNPTGDVYLIRVSATGELVWEKTYGGDGIDTGEDITVAGDGGFLVAGRTSSSGAGGTDGYLVKIDGEGNEVWGKTFGTPLDEALLSVKSVPDGGYLLVGYSLDPDDLVGGAGEPGYGGSERRANVYLVRTDAEGEELWAKVYDEGTNLLVANGQVTSDGGALVLATASHFPEPDDDLYLLRVDGSGRELWARTWRDGRFTAHDFIPTPDGNYLLSGGSSNVGESPPTEEDFFFMKVDPDGNEIWRSELGDPEMLDWVNGVAAVGAGGYVAIGTRTRDFFGSGENLILLRIDPDGELLWEREFETATHNMLAGVAEDQAGGFVVSGSTLVDNRTFDIFVIRTDAEGYSRAGDAG